jgi:hypothetical protein
MTAKKTGHNGKRNFKFNNIFQKGRLFYNLSLLVIIIIIIFFIIIIII